MKRPVLMVLSLAALIGFISCKKPQRYDLIVENAVVLSDSGLVEGKTILIKGDTIAGIVDAGEPVRTRRVVDADGGIVLPGFIDSHTSIACFFKSNGKAFDNHPKNITTFYRSMLSKHFLTHGVTTIVDFESDSSWAFQIHKWKPNPKFSDVLVVVPVEFQDAVGSQAPSAYFYKNGIYNSANPNYNQSSCFWLLTGIANHLQFPKNVEGVQSIVKSLLLLTDSDKIIYERIANVYGIKGDVPVELIALEGVSFLAENNPALLDSVATVLGTNRTSLSTGLYKVKNFVDSGYASMGISGSNAVKQRLKYGFTHLMEYVKTLHGKGVELRFGYNMPFDGSAVAEMQNLFLEYGFSIAEISKIFSYNAAKAFGIDGHKGRISSGYVADLVVFQKKDTERGFDFRKIKRVIKGGRVEKLK